MIEQNHGLSLPRALQQDFSQRVQQQTDGHGKEMTQARLWQLFREAYGLRDPMPLALGDYSSQSQANGQLEFRADLLMEGKRKMLNGRGNGLLSGAVDALRQAFDLPLSIQDYHEHTLGQRSDSRSVAYIRCTFDDNQAAWGVGIDSDISRASLQALLNALTGYLQARSLL